MYLEYKQQRGKPRKGKVRAMHRACSHQSQIPTANAIEKSTAHGYAVGARDYIQFCLLHHLPLDPTSLTLAWYITYTSQFIASGPKYLSGVQHFLHDLYPDFDVNHASPLVKATIQESKKLRADPIRRKEPLRLAHLSAFHQQIPVMLHSTT